MNKSKAIILLGIVAISTFLTSCSSVGGVQFLNVDNEETTQEVIRGKSYQIANVEDGLNMMMTAQPTYDGDEVQVTVGMSNNSDSDYFFQDSSYELLRGNVETGQWESLGRWNAAEYYRKEYDKAKSEEAWATALGVLAILDSTMGSTSQTTVNTPSGTTTLTTRTYSPVDTALTTYASASYVDSLASSNQLTLQNLDSSLLFSSNIRAKSDYAGNIYMEADNKSPEYKITYTALDGEQTDFIFSRSDKEYITNPWKDQLRDKHSIVLSHAIPQDRWQLTYYWSRKEKVGMYVGLSLYNILYKSDIKDNLPGMYWEYSDDWDNFTFYVDPDPNDEWNEDWRYEGHVSLTDEIDPSISVGFPVGITYRVFPNSWLIAGIELGFNDNSYQKVNIQYRNPDGEIFNYEGDFWRFYNELSNLFYAAPQIGFNFIFNWIDVSAALTYRYPLNFYFDVGIGVAF